MIERIKAWWKHPYRKEIRELEAFKDLLTDTAYTKEKLRVRPGAELNQLIDKVDRLDIELARKKLKIESIAARAGVQLWLTYNMLEGDFYHVFDKLKETVSLIENAIGWYQHQEDILRRKRFNPIHWIAKFISIPFSLFNELGLDAEAMEEGVVGKIYKFGAAIIALIVGFVALLSALVSILSWLEIKPKMLLKILGMTP